MLRNSSHVNDIVTACQALALRGCGSGIGGHVSIRVPGEDKLWINAFDRTLGEVTPDDIMMIDFDGNLLEGDREISVGYEFHPGIYGQREDVNAIVHTHGFWVSALGSMARPLKVRHNISCLFHDNQTMSPDDSFASIGPAIGDNDMILIPWHGAITVGRNIDRAAALHATLEEMAKLDITLEPTGAPELPEEMRGHLRELVDDTAGNLEQTWALMRREVARAEAV
jgi:L-fuculose-phosphate aldolase